MFFGKYVNLIYIVIFFIGIIPFIVASDTSEMEHEIMKNFTRHMTRGNRFYQHFGELGSEFMEPYDMVELDSSGQIYKIDIDNCDIPTADIGSAIKVLTGLTNLNELRITNSFILEGIILPEEIGNIKSLKTLIISGNRFDNKTQSSSTIPESIGNLINLEELNISNADMKGSIPKSISNLKQLKSLCLNDNQLIGSIPDEITNLTKLETLNLKNNNLTNTVSPEVKKFISNLKTFEFSGEIEEIKISKLNDSDNNNNNTKIILIIILAFILILVLTVVVIYFKKRNTKINKKGSNNISSSNFERSESISIVVNKNGKVESENESNSVNKSDSSNLNETSENSITISPSSSHNKTNIKENNQDSIINSYRNNDNKTINYNKFDIIKQPQPKPQSQPQPRSNSRLQQFEQELQQQELQLQQQLKLQQLQLHQIQMIKKQLHNYQETPSSSVSKQSFNVESEKQMNNKLQKQQPIIITQTPSITLTHSIISLNPSIRGISNNTNHQNRNYPSTIDDDESPPSYNDVVNN